MLKLQESSVTVCKTQPLCVPKHSEQRPALSCVDSRPSTPLGDPSGPCPLTCFLAHGWVWHQCCRDMLRRQWLMEPLAGALRPGGEVLVPFLSPEDPCSDPSMLFFVLQKALS